MRREIGREKIIALLHCTNIELCFYGVWVSGWDGRGVLQRFINGSEKAEMDRWYGFGKDKSQLLI